MFIGEYQHKIDEKGRLALPVKFRAKFADGAVVTKGQDDCLYLYPAAEWQEIAERLANLPAITNSAARQLQRKMLAGATDVVPDKQGRILLPDYLRTYASLGSTEVVVAGLYKRVELWSPKRWDDSQAQAASDDDLAEHLTNLGI